MLPRRHGTQASRDEYDRVVGEWIAAGRAALAASLSVARLLAKLWHHAKNFYRDGAVNLAGEAFNYRDALKPALRLYGRKQAISLGRSRSSPCAAR